MDPQGICLARNGDPLHELARPTVLLAVVQEEVLDPQAASLLVPAQMHHRAQRDQRRGAVADGRAVGHVAADGGGVADLDRAVSTQEFGEGRVMRREGVAQGLHVGHGADGDLGLRDLHALQVVAARQEGDLAQLAELLGDPEAHIGGAGDQGGVGVIGIPGGQRVGVPGVEGRGADDPGGARRSVAHVVGHGRGLDGPRGAQDRRVAGAAAEVACDLVGMVRRTRCMGGGHRGDEAGRAEAALTAVVVDHRLLDGVERAVRGRDPLDGADGATRQLGQEEDAGVERLRSVLAGHDDRAGAAIALVAALLGAGQAAVAQPVEQRRRRVVARGDDLVAVQAEGNLHGQIRRDTGPPGRSPPMRHRKGGTFVAE